MRLKLCKPYINGFRNVDCTSWTSYEFVPNPPKMEYYNGI